MEAEFLEAGKILKKPLIIQIKPVDINDYGDIDLPDHSITLSVVLSTFFAVCGSFSFGLATGYSSTAEYGIMEDLGLSVAEYSVFGSIMTLGGAIGAVFCGKIAALFGRRFTIWIAQIFSTVGWLAIAFAKDVWWLDFGRLSLGFGVGFISYVVPVYIAEISPKKTRGAFIFTNQLMQNIGIALAYVVGNFIHWRILAAIGLVPCCVALMGILCVPESPRWLAKVGRNQEFETTLRRLRGKHADISHEAADIRDIMETFEKSQTSGMLDLFQRKYAHSLVIGVGLMLLQQLGGSAGLTYYTNSIFERAGFPSKIGTTVLSIILVPKAILVLFLVDKWGRRPLLLISSIGMCFCAFLLGLAFLLQSLHYWTETTPILAFLGLLGYITAYAIGMGGLPWIIMSEIFPMNIKVSAGSLVTFANWSTTWVVTYSFNFMMQWSSSGTFFCFSGVCGATIVFICMLVPETKGRTLEEIQASLTHFCH